MKPINSERLKTLYAAISGIPDDQFVLSLQNGWRPAPNVAHALTWTASYPEFAQAGLHLRNDGCPYMVHKRPYQRGPIGMVPEIAPPSHYVEEGFDVAQSFFDLTFNEARVLFGEACHPLADLNNARGITDKNVFLDRLLLLLEKHHVIDHARAVELSAQRHPHGLDTYSTTDLNSTEYGPWHVVEVRKDRERAGYLDTNLTMTS